LRAGSEDKASLALLIALEELGRAAEDSKLANRLA
jgi:hypothetical protein